MCHEMADEQFGVLGGQLIGHKLHNEDDFVDGYGFLVGFWLLMWKMCKCQSLKMLQCQMLMRIHGHHVKLPFRLRWHIFAAVFSAHVQSYLLSIPFQKAAFAFEVAFFTVQSGETNGKNGKLIGVGSLLGRLLYLKSMQQRKLTGIVQFSCWHDFVQTIFYEIFMFSNQINKNCSRSTQIWNNNASIW